MDKIRCNAKLPLYGALPVPFMPVRITRGALVAHRYTYALSRCRTSQHRNTCIPLSVSLWDDLADSVFDDVGLAGFKSRIDVFYGLSCNNPFVFCCFPFLFFLSIGWYYGAGVFRLIGCKSRSPSFALPTLSKIKKIISLLTRSILIHFYFPFSGR